MITLLETKNIHLIRSIYQDDIRPDLEHKWLVITEDKIIKGVFELQPLTKITMIIHLHIKNEYQNKGLGLKAFNELINFLDNTQTHNLIATIPIKNKHIMSIVMKTKAKCTGVLSDAIIYNNEVQDLVLFELKLNI